ncbi:MAG: XkdF-like putative serine protease domain-containing protein, partial [Candidatus Sericytochromatia bacterium]
MQRGASDFQGFFIGVVFAPGSPDDRDHSDAYTTPEEIERGCDRWALNGSKVGIGHTDIPEEQGANHPHFVLLRNWVQYGDYQIGSQLIKHGTWLQAYQAVSPWAIKAVENYEVNALSAAGRARYFDE